MTIKYLYLIWSLLFPFLISLDSVSVNYIDRANVVDAKKFQTLVQTIFSQRHDLNVPLILLFVVLPFQGISPRLLPSVSPKVLHSVLQ